MGDIILPPGFKRAEDEAEQMAMKRGPVKLPLKAFQTTRSDLMRSADEISRSLTKQQTLQWATDTLIRAGIPFNLIAVVNGQPSHTNTIKDGYEICRHILDEAFQSTGKTGSQENSGA